MSPIPADDPTGPRRREILVAAEKVFARKGFRGSTMGDVAQEVGFTQPALYRYFPSKHALFMQTLGLRQEEIAARYGEALRGPGPAAEKIRALVDTTVAMAVERPEMARLRLQAITMNDEPDVREAVTRTLEGLVNAHAALFAKAREEGALAGPLTPETAASALAGLALFLYASLGLELPYADPAHARDGARNFLDSILTSTEA